MNITLRTILECYTSPKSLFRASLLLRSSLGAEQANLETRAEKASTVQLLDTSSLFHRWSTEPLRCLAYSTLAGVSPTIYQD